MSLMSFLSGRKKNGDDDDDKRSGAKKDAKAAAPSSVSAKKSARKVARPSTRVEPRASARTLAQPQSGTTARTRGGLAVGAPAEDAEDASARRKRASMKGKQIGQLLVKSEALTDENLNRALDLQAKEGGMLGQILVKMELCTRADIGSALRKQRTITTVELKNVDFDPEATGLLEKDFCAQNRLIPFEKIGNQLCVAMANVLDTQAKNDIKEKTQLQLKAFDASWPEIQEAIEREITGQKRKPSTPIAQQAQVEEKQSIDDIVIELPEEELIDFDMGDASAGNAVGNTTVTSAEQLEEMDQKAATKTERLRAPEPTATPAVPASQASMATQDVEILDDDAPLAVIEDDEDLIEIGDDALIEAPEPIATPAPAAAARPTRTSAAMTTALPVGTLEAIPMEEEYFNAIVENGAVTAEHCWVVRHTKNIPLSPLPAVMFGK